MARNQIDETIESFDRTIKPYQLSLRPPRRSLASMGKFVIQPHVRLQEWVAEDSSYQRPQELAGVEVAVGYHSGSHYSAIQGLERFLERDQINLRFAGTPHDRARQLLNGSVPAANLFGAHFYIAEQLGFRK